MSLFTDKEMYVLRDLHGLQVTHGAESESELSLPDCSDGVFFWGLVLSATITILHGCMSTEVGTLYV